MIKAHLLYFANSYFYNCKLSSRILHKQSILWNLKKNKDVVLTKSDKGNGVVILHQELSDNEEIIQDISKFEKLDENPFLKCKASLQRFLCKLKQKKTKKNRNVYDKIILLVLLLLVSVVLLKFTIFPLTIHFLNFSGSFIYRYFWLWSCAFPFWSSFTHSTWWLPLQRYFFFCFSN